MRVNPQGRPGTEPGGQGCPCGNRSEHPCPAASSHPKVRNLGGDPPQGSVGPQTPELRLSAPSQASLHPHAGPLDPRTNGKPTWRQCCHSGWGRLQTKEGGPETRHPRLVWPLWGGVHGRGMCLLGRQKRIQVSAESPDTEPPNPKAEPVSLAVQQGCRVWFTQSRAQSTSGTGEAPRAQRVLPKRGCG